MKNAIKFQDCVERLARKHNADLAFQETARKYRFENEGCLPLIVSVVSEHFLTVAHPCEDEHYLLSDPDIAFFVADGTWMPCAITRRFEETHWYAIPKPNTGGSEVMLLDAVGIAELLDFCDDWAARLQEQLWIDKARLGVS